MPALLASPTKPSGRRAPRPIRPDTSILLPLGEYDLIIVSFSGGKDSLTALLLLLERCAELGIPRERIEVWHQCVDGDPATRDGLFDWPVTEAYCAAVCRVLGLRFRRQWREGGIEGEMAKVNDRSRAATFELPDGGTLTVGGTRGKVGTRGRHPAQSDDMRGRWCSNLAKSDVCNTAICNDPRLHTATVLLVTGERRQESDGRACYATVQRRNGTNNHRRVDQWRAILEYSEAEVWAKIAKWRIVPHPAYRLGFGRVSCMTCVFNGPNEWATVRALDVSRIERTHAWEAKSGHTVRMGLTVLDQADRGTVFAEAVDPALRALALGRTYDDAQVLVPAGQDWQLPAGAYRRGCGPT